MTQPDFETWNRLSPWGIATRVIRALPSLIPALIGLVFLGRAAGPIVVAVIALVISVLVGLLPWLTTRWRVSDDKLELHHGLLRRVTATARRDRIRSVDVTAGPIERMLGLRKVQVGTGVGGDDSALVLDPIPVAIADQLGRDLLRRNVSRDSSAVTDSAASEEMAAHAPHAASDEETLARFAPSWIRFAPFTLTGFAVVAGAVALGFRFLDESGLGERGSHLAESWFTRLLDLGLVVLVPLGVVVVLALSMAISVLAYVVAFWGFTLTRRSDGALHTSRGLISTVAATLERKRVRGVQLHEPVLMRIPRGEKLRAIATGTNRNPYLLPPAPRVEAVRVGDEVLGTPGAVESLVDAHGPAALRRRRTRAVWAHVVLAVPFVVVAIVLPGVWWVFPAVVAIALGVAALPMAQMRYANLGSALSDGAVVLSAGTIARTRTVLEHDGVVGFVVSETFFQRRAGVSTLDIATAAGGFGAVDVTPRRAADYARRINPTIVGPFLEPAAEARATAGSAGTT